MVIARPIHGGYRAIKNQINSILFTIFFLLPFIKLNENPLIWLDIPSRKFHLFGLTIWPQELYFLNLILIIAGLMLFFFTTLFGRVWCAYACPQTLFIELYNFYRTYHRRKKSFGKKSETLLIKIRVWFVWTLLSLVIGFIFVSYFNTIEYQIKTLFSGNIFLSKFQPANWVLWWLAISLFSLLAFAWFRENACKYVCPYGKFQTALLDKHSPIIHYDNNRGEPRRQKRESEHTGDCTACNMCNLVCPTGIDIREGLQIGCIHCGLCVDACEHEMARHDKKTLIDLRTMQQAVKPNAKRKIFRARTIIYGVLLVISISIFITLLVTRIPFYASIIKEKSINSLFIPNIGYQNSYELHLGNLSDQPMRIDVTLQKNNKIKILNTNTTFTIAPGDYTKHRFILRSISKQKRLKTKSENIVFQVKDLQNQNYQKHVSTIFSY